MTDAIRTGAAESTASEALPRSTPEALGIDPSQLDRLYALIESHVRDGRYPGAQVAIARHGRLAALRTFGHAKVDPPSAAGDDTLWLLYSQTKVVVAAAIWQLVDRGALSFADRIADHLPEFAGNGKGEITLHQLLTHQAGFPSARPGPEVWNDHDLRRRTVCDFTLEWTPGSRVHYHGAAAHWVAAVLIEALTGRDYRTQIRASLLDPLGLVDIHVGVPEGAQARCADMHELKDERQVGIANNNSSGFRSAGEPGGGGYATAAAMAAFYQMLAAGGVLNGVRVLSPRIVQHVTRNHTGDRIDEAMGMPMHRGLGPHLRGITPTVRGIGTVAPPTAFGHGGAGSSYSWADPESGLSFTYLSNCRSEEPFHSRRLDRVSNIVHAALVEP
ncbi:MAG: class A beta-lactamase-related serine hydrolase [Chloroflexota bacterium]|nr:MAG: class A beta-lactamase-related serine hydrolase [Chloroflexota bacterium]